MLFSVWSCKPLQRAKVLDSRGEECGSAWITAAYTQLDEWMSTVFGLIDAMEQEDIPGACNAVIVTFPRVEQKLDMGRVRCQPHFKLQVCSCSMYH